MKQNSTIAVVAAAVLAALAFAAGILYVRSTNQAAQQAASNPAVPPLPEGTRSFGPWALTCADEDQGAKRCTLIVRVIDQQTKHMVLSITVTRGPRGNPILIVLTPPSVTTAQGLTVTPATGNEVKAPVQSCTPQRCMAIVLIDDNLRQALSTAPTTTFTYVAGNGRIVSYPLPTRGFAEGFAAFEAEYPHPGPAVPEPPQTTPR
jgi:invasion protein IalB